MSVHDPIIALRKCRLATVTFANGEKLVGSVSYGGDHLVFPYFISDGAKIESRTVAGRYFAGGMRSSLDVAHFQIEEMD